MSKRTPKVPVARFARQIARAADRGEITAFAAVCLDRKGEPVLCWASDGAAAGLSLLGGAHTLANQLDWHRHQRLFIQMFKPARPLRVKKGRRP